MMPTGISELVERPLGRAQFQMRDECVNCGKRDLQTEWHGKFCEETTRSYLQRCNYAEDIFSYLADSTFSLVRCRHCAMRYHRAVLATEWLSKLYTAWVDSKQVATFEAERDQFNDARQLVKHILRLRDLLRTTFGDSRPRLLDYGCGAGRFVSLATTFGWQAYGVEVSAGRPGFVLGANPAITRDLETLDELMPEPAHAVVLFQVLEHVVDPRRLLRELAQRMLPGGILIVEVPDCRGITVPQGFEDFCLVHPLEHINAFSPKTLSKMCVGEGFRRLELKPAHVTTRPIDLLKTELSRFASIYKTQQYFALER